MQALFGRSSTRSVTFSGVVTVHKLNNVPTQCTLFFKLQAPGGEKQYSKRRPVDKNTVVWEESFPLTAKMKVNNQTNVLKPCRARVSVRQITRTGERRVGVAEVNLAEYTGEPMATRVYLLQKVDFNAALTVTVQLKLVAGDCMFKCPPFRPTQDLNAEPLPSMTEAAPLHDTVALMDLLPHVTLSTTGSDAGSVRRGSGSGTSMVSDSFSDTARDARGCADRDGAIAALLGPPSAGHDRPSAPGSRRPSGSDAAQAASPSSVWPTAQHAPPFASAASSAGSSTVFFSAAGPPSPARSMGLPIFTTHGQQPLRTANSFPQPAPASGAYSTHLGMSASPSPSPHASDTGSTLCSSGRGTPAAPPGPHHVQHRSMPSADFPDLAAIAQAARSSTPPAGSVGGTLLCTPPRPGHRHDAPLPAATATPATPLSPQQQCFNQQQQLLLPQQQPQLPPQVPHRPADSLDLPRRRRRGFGSRTNSVLAAPTPLSPQRPSTASDSPAPAAGGSTLSLGPVPQLPERRRMLSAFVAGTRTSPSEVIQRVIRQSTRGPGAGDAAMEDEGSGAA